MSRTGFTLVWKPETVVFFLEAIVLLYVVVKWFVFIVFQTHSLVSQVFTPRWKGAELELRTYDVTDVLINPCFQFRSNFGEFPHHFILSRLSDDLQIQTSFFQQWS